jgi:hypothetical protein
MADAETAADEQQERVQVTITREMYEDLRDSGCYIGEDPNGQSVHLSEDFPSLGPSSTESHVDAWGPVFDIDDRASDLDSTDPVADHDSKTVLTRGETGDRIRVTEVHRGMRRIPEQFEVAKRTNTYFGPALALTVPDDYHGDHADSDHGYRLTCPGPDSHALLWRSVTDPEGFVYSRAKIAKVSVEISKLSGYDVCEQCEEPIQDPMHRTLAKLGECPGGMNDADRSVEE